MNRSGWSARRAAVARSRGGLSFFERKQNRVITKEFFVGGTPKPQGSKRAFLHPHTQKIILTESAGPALKQWREMVQTGAKLNFPDGPFAGDVMVSLVFSLQRPKSHYGTGRNSEKLKDKARQRHTFKPDLDKLTRAVFDGLSGAAIVDDCQVFSLFAMKRWAEINEDTGCWVKIQEVG